MATISFDREIRIQPEDVDRFLDVLEAEPSYKWEYVDIDQKLKEGRAQLAKRFSRRSEKQ